MTMKMNKISSVILILVLLVCGIFIFGCSENTQAEKDYDKCTAVCAAVTGEDFVTLQLCQDECRKKFIEE